MPLSKLAEFQGTLKKLSDEDADKLQRQIETYGMSFPLFVWVGLDGINNVIDGHGRISVLRRMVAAGFDVPPLPVDWIHAASRAEAKRKLLAAASRFGQVTKRGFDAFIDDAGFDLADIGADISFPEIDLSVDDEPEEKEELEGEKNPNELDQSPSAIVHRCPNCNHVFR